MRMFVRTYSNYLHHVRAMVLLWRTTQFKKSSYYSHVGLSFVLFDTIIELNTSALHLKWVNSHYSW